MSFSVTSCRTKDHRIQEVVIEDYSTYPQGPCVLVLQKGRNGQPIHIVWGIPKEASSPAVLVTGYRPDPTRWSDDFTKRIIQ
ncbi:MAG: DUF4258 domain-containing protein [Candidatus Latescibacterota bacterium]|nr:DUF4258 domain-containing protein [Candidatus Latescibacterota bacterium]